MTKIRSISVSNLKPIASLTADFNGATAIITAGNNKGKTSFLKSHIDRLQQTKIGSILKQNTTEGFSEIELTTGEKFVWTFNDKGKEKLTYISERNIQGPVTKELGRMYFPPTFDVDEFLHSQPAQQKKVLQKISGIDFTELDSMLEEAMENRKFANKMEDTEKARLAYLDPKLPTEQVPTDVLEAEISSIAVHNIRVKQVADGLKTKVAASGEIDTEIAELEQKISDLRFKQMNLQNEIAKGQAWAADPKNQPKNNEAELKEKLAKVREQNKEIEANNLARKQQAIYEQAVKNAEAARKEVDRINAVKLDTIKNASMPDGFGFSNDGVTYEGFAFNREALSSSRIYIGALKLAATQLGEVKTLYFDASYLDNNSLQEIEIWANTQGLQLLIEMPDRSGGEITYEIVQAI